MGDILANHFQNVWITYWSPLDQISVNHFEITLMLCRHPCAHSLSLQPPRLNRGLSLSLSYSQRRPPCSSRLLVPVIAGVGPDTPAPCIIRVGGFTGELLLHILLAEDEGGCYVLHMRSSLGGHFMFQDLPLCL